MARRREPERHRLLRRMLEDRRREVREGLRSLREALPAEADNVKDAEEQGLDELARDIDLALTEKRAASLKRIDEALDRLEHGDYGTCVDCGRQIPSARLSAVPFAVRCVPCQEAEEGREAERDAQPRPPDRIAATVEAGGSS